MLLVVMNPKRRAFPAPGNENLFRFRVRQHRGMHQQLVVYKFVRFTGLNFAVQHQHFAENRAFHYLQRLKFGLAGIYRSFKCMQLQQMRIYFIKKPFRKLNFHYSLSFYFLLRSDYPAFHQNDGMCAGF